MTLLGFGALIASIVMGIVRTREIGAAFARLRTFKQGADTANMIDRALGQSRLSVREFLGSGGLHKEFVPPLADTPVIFITGSADSETVKRAMTMKAAGYVLKPVAPDKLSARIAATLKLSGASA